MKQHLTEDLGWEVVLTAKDGRFGRNIIEGGLDKKSAEHEADQWKKAGGVATILPPRQDRIITGIKLNIS